MSNSELLFDLVKAGDVIPVRELIESGADVNEQDGNGWTPLNFAAGKGNMEIVKLLLERGADVFKVGRDQRTPYLIALAAGHVETVKLLREAEKKTGQELSKGMNRTYCRAYLLKDLRGFEGWIESRINWKEDDHDDQKSEELSDDDIVYLHQDFNVTRSMWSNENVIFNEVTPEWEEFCNNALGFKVPDDLDYILANNIE
jgi:ankyrin repeat protein